MVVLERGLAGQGASSRAAGVVRAQGGTPATVALGRFSIDFYKSQQALLGADSGFRELGYLILAVTRRDEREAAERVAMQRARRTRSARRSMPTRPVGLNPTLAPVGHRGGSYCATDGAIDPPRNVRAYSLAMQRAGVRLRERTAVPGAPNGRKPGRPASRDGRPHARRRDRHGTRDPHRRSHAARGGQARRRQDLRGRGAPPGGRDRAARRVRRRAPTDGVRRRRGPLLAPRGGRPAVGDVEPERGSRAGGQIDWPYLRRMERRLHRLVPSTRASGFARSGAAPSTTRRITCRSSAPSRRPRA